MGVKKYRTHILDVSKRQDRQRKRLSQMSLRLIVLMFLLPLLLSGCSLDTFSSSTWQTSTLSNQHIQTLAVNAKNSQVIYAGNGQGMVFESMDSGQHWSMRSSVPAIASQPVTSLLLVGDPTGTKVYAATNAGLLTSVDNAHSWHSVAVSSLPTDIYTIPVFVGTQKIYVGTAHHGIYVSDNGGTVWRTDTTGLPATVAINNVSFDALQHRLWLATSAGIYISDDGVSWHEMNTGLPSGTDVTTVQPAASAGGDLALVYAGTTKGLYLSTDAGAHWTSNTLLQGALIRAILVDYRSRNAATVYICTNVGVFRSDDSGQNWGGVGTGIPHDQVVYALVIGAKQASQLYAASNNVYLFPGNSSTGIDPTRLLSLLVVLLFFGVLFYVVRHETRRYSKNDRKNRKSRQATQTEETTPPSSTPPALVVRSDIGDDEVEDVE